jgi:hypothetical protein
MPAIVSEGTPLAGKARSYRRASLGKHIEKKEDAPFFNPHLQPMERESWPSPSSRRA